MEPSPLDIVTHRIRDRVDRRREDWLTATYHVVALMTDRQAKLIYDLLVGHPLTVHDADLAQLVAQRLGVTPQWKHYHLTGDAWEEGRGHER